MFSECNKHMFSTAPPPEIRNLKRGVIHFFSGFINKAARRIPVGSISTNTNGMVKCGIILLFSGIVIGQTNAQSLTERIVCSLSTTQQSIPEVNLAANSWAGQMLTPWVDVNVAHECSTYLTQELYPYSNSFFISSDFRLKEYKAHPHHQVTHPGRIPIQGIEYLLYQHPNYPWFAVAGRIRTRLDNWTPLQDITGQSIDIEYLAHPAPIITRMAFGIQFQLALVSFGPPPPSQLPAIDHEFIISTFHNVSLYGRYTRNGAIGPLTRSISGGVRFRVNFQSVPATCPTPTVSGGNTRTLAPVRWDELPSVGSVAKHQDLNLQFNNCSNHLSKIRYRIDANGTSPNPGQGLLPLIAPSTASGLAVQVLERRQSDNNWGVSSLGQWRERNTSGGGHTLPMGIRYYRTGNLVGGNVNAAMTISFQYQ